MAIIGIGHSDATFRDLQRIGVSSCDRYLHVTRKLGIIVIVRDYRMNDRQQNELRAITLYTRLCSVPLFEESENDAEILGTGTLFMVNSQHYLVTAAHVLEELIATNRLERIGIPLGGLSAAVSNLGKCNIETFKISDPFDAAIIRFEQPELIGALQIGWHFLSPKDLSSIRADMPNCLVAGYPRVTTRKAGWQLSPKFFCFVSSLLSEVPEYADEVREGLDIFLKHRENGEELDGGTSEVPNLKGVSGASIWGVIPNSGGSVWSAESRLRVIGVQTSCRSGSYIRGKSWELAARVFRRFDERAFEEIEAALNR